MDKTKYNFYAKLKISDKRGFTETPFYKIPEWKHDKIMEIIRSKKE